MVTEEKKHIVKVKPKSKLLDLIYSRFNDWAVYNRYVEFETKTHYVKIFKDHPDDEIVRVKLEKKVFIECTGEYEYYTIYKRRKIFSLGVGDLQLISDMLDSFVRSMSY